jgi:hypothetical protein
VADKWFKLSLKSIIGIFVFSILIFVIGMFLALMILFNKNIFVESQTLMTNTIVGCIGITFVGSSIFYVRKLYKSCIRADISFPEGESDKLRQLGVMFYFLLRPFFSMGFTLLIVLGLKTGILVVTVKETKLDTGFIYLSMFLSFFVGFSSGYFLNLLEDTGKTILTKLFSKEKK